MSSFWVQLAIMTWWRDWSTHLRTILNRLTKRRMNYLNNDSINFIDFYHKIHYLIIFKLIKITISVFKHSHPRNYSSFLLILNKWLFWGLDKASWLCCPFLEIIKNLSLALVIGSRTDRYPWEQSLITNLRECGIGRLFEDHIFIMVPLILWINIFFWYLHICLPFFQSQRAFKPNAHVCIVSLSLIDRWLIRSF